MNQVQEQVIQAINSYVACGVMPIVRYRQADPIQAVVNGLPAVKIPEPPFSGPLEVPVISTPLQAACCAALGESGQLYGWGGDWGVWAGLGCRSQFPELFANYEPLPPSPINTIDNVSNVVVSEGGDTAFIKKDGTLYVSGRYKYEQHPDYQGGDPILIDSVGDIVQAISLDCADDLDYLYVDTGFDTPHSVVYVLRKDGTVWHCAYNISEGEFTPFIRADIDDVVQLAGTGPWTYPAYDFVPTWYALKKDGTVWVRGYDYLGNTGTGCTKFQSDSKDVIAEWTQLPGLCDIVSLSVTNRGGLAVNNKGEVWGWGVHARYDETLSDPQPWYELFGQPPAYIVDDEWWGLIGIDPVPVKLGITDVRQAAFMADRAGAFYLRNDGTVWLVGLSALGMFYNIESEPYDEIAKEQACTQITVNPYIDRIDCIVSLESGIMALRNDGTVWGWGVKCDELGLPAGSKITSPATGNEIIISDVVPYPAQIPLPEPIRDLASIVRLVYQ